MTISTCTGAGTFGDRWVQHATAEHHEVVLAYLSGKGLVYLGDLIDWMAEIEFGGEQMKEAA